MNDRPTTDPQLVILDALDGGWGQFRSRLDGLTSVEMLWEPLGDGWGPFTQHSLYDLVLHAHHEITHHGAEIALMRDLYRARPGAAGGA